MPETTAAGIILAAGKGTRMKSDLPKTMHLVAGLPMVEWVGRAMREAGIARIVIVIGHGGELIQKTFGDRYEYAWQHEQLGTGHAAQMTAELLGDFDGPVIIAPGDAPLLNAEVFKTLLDAHGQSQCTFATSVVAAPKGYGRVVRDASGRPLKIVEEKDANPEEKAIQEVSAAVYAFDAKALYGALPLLKNDNAQGEYYLPDLIDMFAAQGKSVEAVQFDDPHVLIGVNDRWQLAMAERELRRSLLKKHALAGVTLLDPDSTFIGPDVELGVDTVVEAGTSILGSTKAGSRCRLGPYSRIQDSVLGDQVTILMSHVVRAKIGSGSKCGPFANLRPGATLGSGVKIGNFVEVKNANLGTGVSVSHLSYLGDADVGEATNIGAGVITCNYDGFVKSRTTIGKNAFIGSNSTLVAPVEVGDDAIIAAGSTITEDVPTESGAFGRARQETKPGWAARWREKRRSQI
jgi:bifunctional UDP-N-acetylglucosamine pyrophosphorylase/glucosamine-1-phosphate N-acetyltransferase